MSKTKEMVSYIIVNSDLNMGKGKIASQAAHAILDVHRFLISNKIDHKKWTTDGEKIVVLKSSRTIINQLLEEYSDKIPKNNTFNLFPIHDAGRTEVDPGSLTLMASSPVTIDKIPEIIKTLKLL
jgi:PTH2 family peptidyl-tRNA hydrolase